MINNMREKHLKNVSRKKYEFFIYSTVLVAIGLRFSLKIPGNNPKPIKNVLRIYFVLLSVLDQNGLKTKKIC